MNTYANEEELFFHLIEKGIKKGGKTAHILVMSFVGLFTIVVVSESKAQEDKTEYKDK